MPDITMCGNHSCPLGKTCYRHEAKPTPHWQSVSDFKPTEDKDGKIICEYFLEIYEKGK